MYRNKFLLCFDWIRCGEFSFDSLMGSRFLIFYDLDFITFIVGVLLMLFIPEEKYFTLLSYLSRISETKKLEFLPLCFM